MTGRLRGAAIVAIAAVGAFVRAHDLNSSWVGMHNAWGGAMYGGIARNTVRYGYWLTGFGPVTNSGHVSPERFEYYYHYPPLLNWMVAASFSLFGVHEWSARIVPLAFSIALMILIFAIARRLFSSSVAFTALVFSAVIPVEAYYGAHVDVYNSVAVFFSALAVYGYARWLDTSRAKDFALCMTGVVLGCMASWFTYFAVPLILVHYLFLRDGNTPKRRRSIWLLPLAAVAVFALFLLHRHLLMSGGKTEIMGSLLDKLRIRTSIESPVGENAGVLGLVYKHARDIARLYSIPLLLLVAAWIGLSARTAFERKLQTRDWMVLILFGYGFLHNLIFPSLLLGHDYMVQCYVPAFAIAAAISVDRIGTWILKQWGSFAHGAAVATMMLVTLSAEMTSTRWLQSADSQYANSLRRWGNAIQARSRDTDLILTCNGEDRILEYYVDRQMKFNVSTPRQFEETNKARTGKLFACPDSQREKDAELIKQLDASYPQTNANGMTLYDISR